MTIRYIDLFAGIGGLRLGLEYHEDTECVFSSEIDSYAQKTYQLNFKEEPAGDIRKIPAEAIPPHDILLAGFPCQSFSIAGNTQGFKDKRGVLFYEIIRVLKHRKPQAFLLENVKGLCFLDKGQAFKIIIDGLRFLGYNIFYKVLNTMHYGDLPQTRERIYIVGFLNHDKFEFPDKIPLKKTIKDMLSEGKQEDKYYYNDHFLFNALNNAMISSETAYQWRRSYVRENKNNVCPALTAIMGTGGHNIPIIRDDYGIRKLTPRECARFQGFSDYFLFPYMSDCHKYKQIGNSVSVPVIKRIADNIVMTIKGPR